MAAAAAAAAAAPTLPLLPAGTHVLVSGAGGGIGAGLCAAAAAMGCAVTAQVRPGKEGDAAAGCGSVLAAALAPLSAEARARVRVEGCELATGAACYREKKKSDADVDDVDDADVDEEAAADARCEAAVAALFARAAAGHGGVPVQVLVANHAIFEAQDAPLADMSLRQWKTTLDVNLTGVFLLCRAFLQQLRAARAVLDGAAAAAAATAGGGGGGDAASSSKAAAAFKPEEYALRDAGEAVILVGSTAGKFGEALHADYAASKSALMYGFARSLKNELVKISPNARCNVVAPGWTRTAMAEPAVARGVHLQALQTMPLRKIAAVDDVVNACLFLASPYAAHTTGNIIEVDGGMEGRVLNTLDELKQAGC